MSVTSGEMKRIARLAHLRVEERELERLARQSQQMVEYVSQLQAVDTDGVLPTYQTTAGERSTPLRADEVIPSLPVEDVLAGAPDSSEGHFRVPPVIEEE